MGNLLIFGGTFDPPHKGHRHLLETALKQADFEHVLLIPTYQPPHKDHHPALSFENRAGILKIWFGDIEGLEIIDIEQKRGGKSFTVDTIGEIQQLYPNDTLHLLIGTDMFLDFESWYCFEKLLENVVLVVGSRECGDRGRLEEHKNRLVERYNCKGIILCDMKPIVFASSALRAAGNGLAEQILGYISEHLDQKRVRHTLLVADYARDLAQKHGVNEEQAYLAGLLHDCTKCYPTEWHIQYAKEQGIALSAEDLASPQILHQITVPCFAKETFGVSDEAILSAIGCHSTGKQEMSPLDQLIFFADGCEPSREYPDVEKIRDAGEENPSIGALLLLEHTMEYIKRKNAPLHPQTLAARDAILKELNQNG